MATELFSEVTTSKQLIETDGAGGHALIVTGGVGAGGVVTVASGGIASGAVASGAIATGAIADMNAANTARTTATRVMPVQVVSPAGEANVVQAKPFAALLEGGLTELVGEDEAVAQNQYGGSIGVALTTTCSGTIEQITLICGENGDGAILKPSGVLYVLDADPTIAAADTAMTAAEWATVIAKVNVSAADWGTGDATGAIANPIVGLPIAFHSLANLYFVWFHTLATGFNAGAANNESLDLNFWYRRES